MAKKKLVINNDILTKQLDKDEPIYNWIVIAGLKQFNEGKIGKQMTNFLTFIGVLEYK